METVTKIRQCTKLQVCDRHAPWFAGQGRARTIECFVEGGPGGWTPGCSGGRCRIWPGRDYFVPEVCLGEIDIDDWTEPLPTASERIRDAREAR